MKKDQKRIAELIKKGHDVEEAIVEMAELTKQYYDEAEYEEFGEIFNVLNQAYCEAGTKVTMANIDACIKQINICVDAIHMFDEEFKKEQKKVQEEMNGIDNKFEEFLKKSLNEKR